MSETSQTTTRGLGQPFIELLYSAEIFGCDFQKGNNDQHLSETLGNLRHIKRRAISCIDGLGLTLETMSLEGHGIDIGTCEAVSFLAKVVQDFDFLEEKITDRMARKKGETS